MPEAKQILLDWRFVEVSSLVPPFRAVTSVVCTEACLVTNLVLGDSDLLTVYNAYLAWKRVCVNGTGEYQFCRKNFLSQQTLSNIEDLKGQLLVCLVDSGLLPLTEAERTALNRYVISSV